MWQEGGAAKDDPMARRDALRAVSEVPARLRGLLPSVDLISSAEVADLTHRLYDAWNAYLRALRESDTGASEPGDDTVSYQEGWPKASSALHGELLRWNIEGVYGSLRQQMHLKLGIELDGDTVFFTPYELRMRVEAFSDYVDRDE